MRPLPLGRLTLLTLLACLCAAALPGCVFWEIRDELKKTNAQLDEVKSSLGKLDTTNASLDKTNADLDRVSALIGGVGEGLGRIDTTNASLDSLQRPLALMTPIESSLGRLDNHLAALRRTIGRIDTMMPFLDLGGGDAPPEPAPSAATDTPNVEAAEPRPAEKQAGNQAGAEAVAGKSSEGSPPAAAGAPSADKRDTLAGAWVSKFPERNLALFLLPDGSYVQATRPAATGTAANPGTMFRERGTWKRDGNTIALESLPQTVKLFNGTSEEHPAKSSRLKVLWSSSRAMAVEVEGALVVFERP